MERGKTIGFDDSTKSTKSLKDKKWYSENKYGTENRGNLTKRAKF